MLLIRSLIFLLLQIIITPIFCVACAADLPVQSAHALSLHFAMGKDDAAPTAAGMRHSHEVRGIENLPKQPCIVMCKHQSAWETLALQKIFPPQVWVLKRELLWIPFFGWALALTSPIAIKRSDGKGAMKQLLKQGKQRLAQGFCVVIFPEGTRIPYGQRGKYKIGGALLAASSGVPVIPVAHNAGRLWGRNAFSKHPGLITMSIGAPIETRGLKADEINQRVEAWIENEIQNLAH